MSNYRGILYAGYSSHFGELKVFDHGRSQFPLFDSVYSSFDSEKDAVILDGGCGKGEWLGWLKNKGYNRLVGVDGSESDLNLARSWLDGVQFHCADLLDHLESAQATYDVIHAKDVIEHLTKDEIVSLLLGARKSLKPGGRLWIQTFNAQAPLAAATRYGDFTHETGLTPQSLAQCLRACGFPNVKVRGVHYCSGSAGGVARRFLSIPVTWAGRMVLRLRHGGAGSGSSDVDRFCVKPDMLAVAY